MQTKPRKKRFELPEVRRELKGTSPQLDFYAAVYQHSLIPSDHLPGILWQPDGSSTRTQYGVTNTQTDAHEGWLVHKPEDTRDLFGADVLSPHPFGMDFYLQHREELPPRVCKFHRPRGSYRRELPHNLGTAMTMASIQAGHNQHGLRFTPQEQMEWNFGKRDDLPISFPASLAHEIKGKEVSWNGRVYPDSAWQTTYPDGQTSTFILEYQRAATISRNDLLSASSQLRKYLAYYDAFQKGTLKAEWGLDDAYFVVLFVYTNIEKYHEALNLCAETFTKDRYPSGVPMFYHLHVPMTRKTDGGAIKLAKPLPDLITRPCTRIGRPDRAIYEQKNGPTG